MAKALKVFLVEDEVQIANFIALELHHEGFEVTVEYDGKVAYERILGENYDLVLLDWMLPGMEGVEVCRKVREVSDVPIIMLTAKGDLKERVMGLQVGADDYLTKPFAVEELLARMGAVLRKYKRMVSKEDEVLAAGDVVLIPGRGEVRLHGKLVEMSVKELKLLEFLLRSKRKIVTRQEVLQNVWGYDYVGDTNVVDVYIRYLRQKLEAANGDKKLIYTVRGMGYVVKD